MQKTEHTVNPRPVFLTLLCIITFVNAVSDLWTNATFLWSPGVRVVQIQETMKEYQATLPSEQHDPTVEAFNKWILPALATLSPQSIQLTSVILLIYYSLVLFAVYLIWNRERKGFRLYLLATVFTLVAPYFFMNGILALLLVFGVSFISLIFCLLFYFNLKHLQ